MSNFTQRAFARPLAILLLLVFSAHAADDPRALAKQIFDATNVRGGFVVHLGCGDGTLTAALRLNDSFQVQGIDTDAARVNAARAYLYKEGVYGDVCIERFDGTQLPYIDNLVNLLVAEDLGGVPLDEVKRVLVPDGVAYIKQNGAWTKIVKPRPAEMDEWTHYYYDSRGNAVSKDMLVAPPERLQWVGSPRWSRHHDRISSLSAMVSTGGRMYYIMDQGSRVSILMPSKWILTARDAFNGTILWQQPIEKWQTQLWPLKSGPTQLTRRLVGDGNKIYVTKGIDAPVSCLDGATGDTIRVYETTKGAEEILHCNGVLYVLVNPNAWQLEDFAPKFNTGDQQRVETEFNWDGKARELHAVDVATGNLLWKKQNAKIAPLTLATDGKRVVFYDGEKIVGLDPKNGEQRWESAPEEKRKLFEFNYGPRLLLHDNVVLYAGGTGTMKSLNADTGKDLWTAPHSKSGYRSPEDLIVTGGLVWNAPTTSGGMSGAFSGRDLLTGDVKSEFPPDIKTYWFHHRCYIAKATERFILPSRTGIEFVDFNAKHWEINHWVRGACLYGVMPCNGLVYAGPHDCACYPETKLFGLNALAPALTSAPPKPMSDEQRLERGPAYADAVVEEDADAKDWPTYRHDAARSGYTNQAVDENLEQNWEVKLGGRLSAPIVAAGKLFVAQIDRHTLHALDASNGKLLWHFTAGGRVDSPPTYWKGRVVFGCMDGSVYCLRANDGALIWRYRVAPVDRRHMAFEQLESVWPVHGSVVVENGAAACVAGRDVFLDGGLRFMKLDVATGKKLVEVVYDNKDPDTGLDLQTRVKTLQMPTGLNDILSSDGKYMYLHSQKIAADGKRVDIGPASGSAIEQGAAQRGGNAHIFAPMGFVDDSWFHRSYWVFGEHFAGGHDGYFQAGRFTPTGRMLVFDDKDVYAYGRQPQYFKWTTTMEYQLYSASREAPDVPPEDREPGRRDNTNAPHVRLPSDEKLDPSRKPLSMEMWIFPGAPNGVIASHGGPQNGYAITLKDRKPAFSIRTRGELSSAASTTALDEGWHHVAGVLAQDKKVLLYVDGKLAAEAKAAVFLQRNPNQGFQLGAADKSLVSDHGKGEPYIGLLDQFALYHRALTANEIADRAALKIDPVKKSSNSGAIVAYSFDNGDARDQSGNKLHGTVTGVETGEGKIGGALLFRKKPDAHPQPEVAASKPDEKPVPPVSRRPDDEKPVAQKEKDPTQPDAEYIKDQTDQRTKDPNAKKTLAPVKSTDWFIKSHWARPAPIFARAMAKAGDTLLYAGPPDTVDEEYAFERLKFKDKAILNDLEEQNDALNDKKGAKLLAVSKSGDGLNNDGQQLESSPVWDGMVVARGKVFIAAVNGKVICLGKGK
ncbi:MAG TPA: PQQ-binding-like beta-propeller repeat protein [Planctomycetota bacterium]|nr:PQQ-binding-like beta-propeller repeat protein [Planctomycetota bacterium]